MLVMMLLAITQAISVIEGEVPGQGGGVAGQGGGVPGQGGGVPPALNQTFSSWGNLVKTILWLLLGKISKIQQIRHVLVIKWSYSTPR